MKKIMMLATAAFLFSGVAFAHGDKDKTKEKSKKTCSKANGKCCGKGETKKS